MIIMILGILVFLGIIWVIYDYFKLKPVIEYPAPETQNRPVSAENPLEGEILPIKEKKEAPKFYIDERGYERDEEGVLIHRKVAWQYLYDVSEFSKNFREYDVHHKDRNKRNNHKDNLQILTREEHKKEHGQK